MMSRYSHCPKKKLVTLLYVSLKCDLGAMQETSLVGPKLMCRNNWDRDIAKIRFSIMTAFHNRSSLAMSLARDLALSSGKATRVYGGEWSLSALRYLYNTEALTGQLDRTDRDYSADAECPRI